MSVSKKVSSKRPLSFVGHYWVRTGHGFNFRLVRLPPRQKLPVCDQLILAILRGDADECQRICTSIPAAAWVAELSGFVGADQLAVLIYERIYELGLTASLQHLCTPNGTPLLSHLRQAVADNAQKYERHDALFLELLVLLSPFEQGVVFIKGTVLSRTLHKQPHHRLSVDFDIVVREEAAQKVISLLSEAGFEPIFDDPGHCHQLGIGPVGSLEALTIRPACELEPWHNLCLLKRDWPYVELKSSPLESGLKMIEADRFWSECEQLSWQNHTYFAPGIVDHLMLEVAHLRKHSFAGWPWLYDVHLLVEQLNQTPLLWSEFVRRCRLEGVATSAWAALDIVRDRLETPVPAEVMHELQPRSNLMDRLFTFSIESAFLWNLISLPALFLNAAFAGDGARKSAVLKRCLLPDSDFLSRYYCRSHKIRWWQYPAILLLHWFVLIFPASIIRRTIGRFLWASPHAG